LKISVKASVGFRISKRDMIRPPLSNGHFGNVAA
jgi:hypothetical protein